MDGSAERALSRWLRQKPGDHAQVLSWLHRKRHNAGFPTHFAGGSVRSCRSIKSYVLMIFLIMDVYYPVYSKTNLFVLSLNSHLTSSEPFFPPLSTLSASSPISSFVSASPESSPSIVIQSFGSSSTSQPSLTYEPLLSTNSQVEQFAQPIHPSAASSSNSEETSLPKVRRRSHAEDYILEKQLEESSKYSLHRSQAMEKFQHYAKRFHVLKQQLNNSQQTSALTANAVPPASSLPPSASSSSSSVVSSNAGVLLQFPVAPPSGLHPTLQSFSSSRYIHSRMPFRSSNGTLFNANGTAALNGFAVELHPPEPLPPEDEPRLFTMEKFCEICWCNSKKRETLKCMRTNQLTFIPILPYKERLNVLEM